MLINDLIYKNVQVDLIIIQETWEIKHVDLLLLSGFQKNIHCSRKNMICGGVGIFVRKGVHFKIRNDLEAFHQKTFENLVIELNYPNKSFVISNIYAARTKRLQSKHLQTKRLQTKRLRDKRSTGKKVYGTKRLQGQKVYRDKTSTGQKVYWAKNVYNNVYWEKRSTGKKCIKYKNIAFYEFFCIF
jgi:hypothetical protein